MSDNKTTAKEPAWATEFVPDEVFDRDDFIRTFQESGLDEELVMDLCEDQVSTTSFLLYTYEGEWCVLYKFGEIVVSWYKHLGRSNTCSKEGFTLDDLAYFWKLLKKDIDNFISQNPK